MSAHLAGSEQAAGLALPQQSPSLSIGQLLCNLGEEFWPYCDEFEAYGLRDLPYLTEDDLEKDVKISKGVHRRRLLAAIKDGSFHAAASPACPPFQSVDKDAFVKDLTAAVGSHLVLDESRRSFVQETARILYDLLTRGAGVEIMSRFRRLLMGRKGAGKTSLLTHIQDAAAQLGGPTLLCVYVSYESSRVPPLQSIRKALLQQYRLRVPLRVDTVEVLVEWLEQQQRVLFLVLDELQIMFTPAYTDQQQQSSELAKRSLAQVASIGSSQKARIHCILSGSSTWLRRLCFHKMHDGGVPTAANAVDFPHYVHSSDMNSTKYTAYWIHPFAAAADFRAAYEHHSRGTTPSLHADADALIASAYLSTGGLPFMLEKWLRNSGQQDLYTLGVRKLAKSSAEYDLLLKIYNTVRGLLLKFQAGQPEGGGLLEVFATYTRMVAVSAVLPGPEAESNISTLYNLADAGYVRYQLGQPNSEARVGLASAALFVSLAAAANPCQFSLSDYFALLNPTPPCDAQAERVVMQCLTQRKLKEMQLPRPAGRGIANLQLPNAGAAAAAAAAPAASATPAARAKSPFADEPLDVTVYAEAPVADLLERVFKESYGSKKADTLGADLVLFDNARSDVLVVHRVQVKLGLGANQLADAVDGAVDNPKKSWLQIVADKFKGRLPEAEAAYARKGVRVELRHYLLTTRGYKPQELQPLLKCAGADGILDHVFNAKQLREELWTDGIKALGVKPFA
jgi:hypothetical protein